LVGDGDYVYNDGWNSCFDPRSFYEKAIDNDGKPLLKLKAFYDQNRMNQVTKQPDPAWVTAEIVSEDKCDYGRYAVTVKADDFGKLNPSVVLGIFTYQFGVADPNTNDGQDGHNNHREIDLLETISGDMQTKDNNNAQFALQRASANPVDGLKSGKRFTIPTGTPYITVYLNRPDPLSIESIEFKIYSGNYTLSDITNPTFSKTPFAEWIVTKDNPDYRKVPKHVNERMHINFYAPDPKPNTASWVAIKRFDFWAHK
jgi:hypothetical protein